MLAKVAGNLLLSGFMTLIRNLMCEWISASLQAPGVAAAALHQHRKIFGAIRDGQAELAGQAMPLHLEAVAKPLAHANGRQTNPTQLLPPPDRNGGDNDQGKLREGPAVS